MLFIQYEDGSYLQRWIGQQLPSREDAELIQADGDELEHIKNLFENIPMRKDRKVVSFHGDLAKFIIRNW